MNLEDIFNWSFVLCVCAIGITVTLWIISAIVIHSSIYLKKLFKNGLDWDW